MMLQQPMNRAPEAFRLPEPRHWLEALVLFGVYAAITAPVIIATDMFTFQPRFDATLLVIALIAFFAPALGEELVFRVILQPKPGQDHQQRRLMIRQSLFWLRIVLSLILFLLWHPAQIWLGLPTAQPMFAEPVFLGAAGLMAVACTISYQRSASIWPAITAHWALVVGQKALFA